MLLFCVTRKFQPRPFRKSHVLSDFHLPFSLPRLPRAAKGASRAASPNRLRHAVADSPGEILFFARVNNHAHHESLTPLECALTNKHRVLTGFDRNYPPVSALECALTQFRAVTSLECAVPEKVGGGVAFLSSCFLSSPQRWRAAGRADGRRVRERKSRRRARETCGHDPIR